MGSKRIGGAVLRLAVLALCFWPVEQAAAQSRSEGAPPAGKRVALVIGNSAYANLIALENPVRDAKAVAAVLRSHAFRVLDGYDLDRNGLLDILETFRRDYAERADEALVFYAGHGMAVERDDVLAPVDMTFDCARRTASRTVKLEELQKALGEAPRQVVVLDACRNDAFKGCRATGAGEGFRGLSRDTVAGVQQLTVNSTLTGKVATDGEAGGHSPFAAAMLARLESGPSVPLRDVFDVVAADVSAATQGAQVPEVIVRGGAPKMCLSSEKCGAGIFAPAAQQQVALAPGSVSAPDPRELRRKEASEVWASIKDGASEAQLEIFIRDYGDTPLATYAKARLTEMRRKQTPVNLTPQQAPEATREFFLGAWRVDLRMGGTLIKYHENGSLSGRQLGAGRGRPLGGTWRFQQISRDTFHLKLHYSNGTSWQGTFKVVDQDHIHNVNENYVASREK